MKLLHENSRWENGGGLFLAMPPCQAPQTFGFFDVELRVQWLVTKGNPLSRLDAVVDWEQFRPLLDAALVKPAKGPGGRPPHDRLKMFKTLVVQRFYNLSDEQTEYQVSDRLSFQQFIGWTLADKAPDANTIWDFREALIQADVFEKLFELFGQRLQERGLLAQPGKLVDASFVDVPRQRNPRAENATIKGGATPAAWAEQPAKLQQKDVDARWTKKNAEVHYGYKNHVKADAQSKLIEQYAVTDASVHDSQKLEALVATTDGTVYVDSAYRSAEAEAMLTEKAVTSQIHERAYRNRPLTEEQKESNRQKSKIRVRIEPKPSIQPRKVVTGGSLLSGVALLILLGGLNCSARVLSIAHRGGALYAPENTIAAFTNSLAVTDLMEADAQITSDGKFVIMHDLTVDRTTDGTGLVATQTLAQLKLLDAGSWYSINYSGQRIPTMEEMITNTLPLATPFIEHKAGAASNYVAEFRRLNVVTNVILNSFNWTFLAAVHALEPNLRLCALGSGTLTAAKLITITNAGARIVSWAGANITSNEVSLVHGMGLTLFVWTVNSGAEITNFINLGVDGIGSDDPWAVRGVPPPIVVITNPPPAPTYLGDRLVAYWKMDDGLANAFATTVMDSQDTNHATLVRNDGISHWISGSSAKLGGSLQLAGSNAFVNLPANPNLDLNTNELSLSLWVRLEVLPTQLGESFSGIFASATDCYVLYLDKGNNELRFKVTDANTHAARPGIPAAFLQTNQWLHVVGVFNGNYGSAGRALIYLNGALMDTHTGNDGSIPMAGLTANVKTGQLASLGRKGPTGAYYFSGLVDDAALWNRALTPTEIQNIYNSGQLGQHLGDLLIQPTNLLTITSIRQTPPGVHLAIQFQNQGPWSAFQLRRATNLAGPYFPISGLTPVVLGGGNYRYEYSPTNTTGEIFRIEGL